MYFFSYFFYSTETLAIAVFCLFTTKKNKYAISKQRKNKKVYNKRFGHCCVKN